ncbi:hypothetical protein BEL04_12415 [Mucilaginibacter sp. PPCGB 2223]|uniref:WD40/YVTN/BNR-like repeat-containing protein n=1 Tax=Mucilaginibacter sp. PPCGB 2223 TaxID=1886027 RepID=UPI0008246DC1|nr:hypothetical protein [Mucilaginibacter sp. PPCGB 2223]OCX52274.1 hypothetical protein BEL04_12415 [Mucilaginibacter sp. PPCGB 2223]
MKSKTKFKILSLLCLSLAGCKKSDPANQTPNSGAVTASIQVVSGNNQLGYAGKRLPDTIVLKVTPGNPADTAKLGFTTTGAAYGQFTVIGRTSSNGTIYIKALWMLATNATAPSITFYTNTGCNIAQGSSVNCKAIDSVKLSATVRKPWASIYTGAQGGYNVLYDLSMTDLNHAIALGEGSGVIRTADGGKTWIQGAPIRSDNDMEQLAFSGPDTGLVILVNNYAWFTYDGGATYKQENWTPPFVGDRSSAVYKMLSRKVIYTAGWRGQIAKTTDGGVTWAQEGFTFLNNFRDMAVKGKDTLYACGDVGKIVKTTNAGKTWLEQPLQLNNYLNTLFFVTNNFGFAGGEAGVLIRTTDGINWSVVKTGLRFPIIAIRFFNAQHGYIVSNSGEVAESKDGGLTWTTRCADNYGVYSLNKAVIKDQTTIFGLQQAAIFTFDLTQP